MKYFDLKIFNKKSLIALGLPILFIYIICVGAYIFDNVEGESRSIFTVVIAIIPIFIIFPVLVRLCKKDCTVNLSDTQIVLRRNGLVQKSIYYKDIIFIRQFSIGQARSLVLFAKGSTKPNIELLQVAKSSDKMDDILDTLLKSGTYIKTQRLQNNQLSIEYINQSIIDSQSQIIADIKSDKISKNRKKKAIVIGIIVFILLLLIPVAAILISKGTNNNKQYIYDLDNVYFNDKKLGINLKEVDRLSYNIIKDSSHIYYKGEVLEWADRETFKCIQVPFYYDKNGIYYETSNLFSENKILPIEGDYDHPTFKYVGRLYYKDKDKLYRLRFNIVSLSDTPLEKISIDGIDLPSFQLVNDLSFYWFKDKNKVYFASDKKIRPVEDIDPATFEVVNLKVAKDKKHVYHITDNLKAEEYATTDYGDYTILKNTDTSTFEIIDSNNLKNKDTTRIIEN